ncbi:hypothetical protein C8J55DRAFT_401544, partial [Lentinula edodes]
MTLPGSIPTLQAHNTGNYTRVDNVFCTDTVLDHVIVCDTVPSKRPILTDHLPIHTILDIQIPTVDEREHWNWAKVDWEEFAGRLEEVLGELEPPREIETEEIFWTALGNFDAAIQQVTKEVVPKAKPSPHQRRWWNSTLTEMKKKTGTLSAKSHK